MYTVYILFSKSSLKYYTRQTDNLEDRLFRHNSGQSISTKSVKPWEIVYKTPLPTRSEAMLLELKIKKRGAKRYLQDINSL
jgi:putative endonuclease